MLEIKNLDSGYDKTQILHDINIIAKRENITLIIGPNGCGKSTILKSIYNFCNIYEGEVLLEDISLKNLKPYELIDLGVSFVLQRNVVFPTLSLYENLEVAAKKYNNKQIMRKEIEKILEIFESLKSLTKTKAGMLSGGQQRLLGIAMALLQNPKVLLLDEPSAGLSPKAASEVFDIIKKIKNEGVIILLVEQNVNLASKIADKIYVIDNGKVVHETLAKDLDPKKLKEIYLKV